MSRGRLRTEKRTVPTDTGAPLRGGVAEVFRYGKKSRRTRYSTDPAYYTRLRRARLNAVRVVCSDPWQRSNGYMHWDLGAHGDRKAFLAELDTVVQLAAANHLYSPDRLPRFGRLDLEHAYQFWDIVAPRYASAPQVFYELANEPVGFWPVLHRRRFVEAGAPVPTSALAGGGHAPGDAQLRQYGVRTGPGWKPGHRRVGTDARHRLDQCVGRNSPLPDPFRRHSPRHPRTRPGRHDRVGSASTRRRSPAFVHVD